MPAPDPFAPFVEPLERLGLPYCITGSVAASIYGEPRLTADIDIVLLLRVGDIAALKSAFPDSAYYVPPDEMLRIEVSRSSRGMFNLIHHASQFKADIYLAALEGESGVPPTDTERAAGAAWELTGGSFVDLRRRGHILSAPYSFLVGHPELPDRGVRGGRPMVCIAASAGRAWPDPASLRPVQS